MLFAPSPIVSGGKPFQKPQEAYKGRNFMKTEWGAGVTCNTGCKQRQNWHGRKTVQSSPFARGRKTRGWRILAINCSMWVKPLNVFNHDRTFYCNYYLSPSIRPLLTPTDICLNIRCQPDVIHEVPPRLLRAPIKQRLTVWLSKCRGIVLHYAPTLPQPYTQTLS